MRYQTDLLEILPRHQIDDVGDVGVEDHLLAEKVRPIAIAGERLRVDLVAVLFQNVSHAPPAPAAMPRPMNEYKRLARIRLRPRLRNAGRRESTRQRAKRDTARDR